MVHIGGLFFKKSTLMDLERFWLLLARHQGPVLNDYTGAKRAFSDWRGRITANAASTTCFHKPFRNEKIILYNRKVK
jgi:hypothetical protein